MTASLKRKRPTVPRASYHREAGMNLIELMLSSTILGITFGVLMGVGHRFGLVPGVIAALVTLVALLACYALLLWIVGFLPPRLGGPPQIKKSRRPKTRDSNPDA